MIPAASPGFVVPARSPVHHFSADTNHGFFLSSRNLPSSPDFQMLALQYAIRHYCGSDYIRAAGTGPRHDQRQS
jgi:hypothetical protein